MPLTATADSTESLVNLSIVVSFDPTLLTFDGILNSTSTAAVTFSIYAPVAGLAVINGTGPVRLQAGANVVVDLLFGARVTEPFSSSVRLASIVLGGYVVPEQQTAVLSFRDGWTNVGPHSIGSNATESGGSGQVDVVGMSPYFPSTLYIAGGIAGSALSPEYTFGSDGGVFRTTNGGLNWTELNVGLDQTSVDSLYVNWTNPQEVVAGTSDVGGPGGGGVYKTVNGGATWQLTYPDGANWFTYLNGTLYAATHHALLASSDFGSSWRTISRFPAFVTTAQVANSGREIWVGLFQGNKSVELLRSTNGGQSYAEVGFFPGYESVSQILQSPTNPQVLWSLVYDGYTNKSSLYNTTDGGSTWTAVNDSAVGIQIPVVYSNTSGTIYEAPQGIAIDPKNGSTIWVTGPGYLYRSTNGGSHFSMVGSGQFAAGFTGGDNRILFIDPLLNSTVYLGSDQGLVVTRDSGATWTDLGNRSNSMLYSVVADGPYIYTVAQDWGPISSVDSGANWSTGTNGSEEGWTGLDPYNSSILAFASSLGSVLEVSTDGGMTLFQPSIPAPGIMNVYRPARGIAFVNDSQHTMFIISDAGVWISNNTGVNWTLLPGSPVDGSAIAVDPRAPGTLFVSTVFNATYRSTNWGHTWQWWTPDWFWSLAVDPLNDSILFGMKYNEVSSLAMVSYDGGRTFQLTPAPLRMNEMPTTPPSLTVESDTNGTLAVAVTGGQGIYLSYNMGADWVDANANLADVDVSNLCLEPNGSAYISTWGSGVWYTPILFDQRSDVASASLSGWLPLNSSMTVGGVIVARGEGYFETSLSAGTNQLVLQVNGKSQTASLNATANEAYFVNGSLTSTSLSIHADGLPSKQPWFAVVNNATLSSVGGRTLVTEVPQGNDTLYSPLVGGDYAVWSASPPATLITSFLPSRLTVEYSGTYDETVLNISSEVASMEDTVAYSSGYYLWGGANGGIAVVNSTTGASQPVPHSLNFISILAASAYAHGFLLAGRPGNGGAALFEYTPQNGSLLNLTPDLPAGWASPGIELTTVQGTPGGEILFAGSGDGMVLAGRLVGSTFTNLSSDFPSDFQPYFGMERIQSTYVSSSQDWVIATNGPTKVYPDNMNDHRVSFGVLNVSTGNFSDWSFSLSYSVADVGSLPASTEDYEPALRNIYNVPGLGSMASDGSNVLIVGDYQNGTPFVATFSPASGITDISHLFPANEWFTRVAWNGQDYLLSGASMDGLASAVWTYNPTSGEVEPLASSQFGSEGASVGIASASPGQFAFTGIWFGSSPLGYQIPHISSFLVNLTGVGTVIGKVTPVTASVVWNGTVLPTNGGNFQTAAFAGTYSLVVSQAGYRTVRESITVTPFTVSNVAISLVPYNYTISFDERGLPAGTNWNVTLNGTNKSSTGSSVQYSEPNGTFPFTIDSPGWQPSPGSGSVTVNGANQSLLITFSQVNYTVTFRETGLPTGTNWSVTLGGSTQKSATDTITFQEPNGTYAYVIADVPGWHETTLPYTGSVTVNGGAVNEPDLVFAQVTYPVTFTESGLPPGTQWWVNVTGMPSASSTTDTITLALQNQSYTYSVETSNKEYSTTHFGSFTENGGSPSTVSIAFQLVTYAVTFRETGLPTGTNWSVTLNGTNESSTGSSITFTEPNGTYPYTIHSPGWQPVPGSGSVMVNGTNQSILITFSQVTYTVTFRETGLPTGTTWSVTLGGSPHTSTTDTITFQEPNGTYAYSIANVPGWHETTLSYTGTVPVDGAAVGEPTINYTQETYSVTVRESGLPSGTTWSVTLNGMTYSSTTSVISALEPNGTYTYSVGALSGWHQATLPYSGLVTVNGTSVNEPTLIFAQFTYTVTFTETGLPTGTSWTVTMGGIPNTSTSAQITFQEPNGTYAFGVGPVSGYAVALSAGDINVSGGPVHETLTFSPSSSGPSSGFLGLSGDTGYFILGGIAVLVVVVASVAMLLRRKGK